MVFENTIVIDGRGHLVGRLASTIAKELLNGQRVVVVRAEDLEFSGPMYHAEIKLKNFRAKRTNTNPEKGPFNVKTPSGYLKRIVRGMIPHKTKRGTAAMLRLKVFEGIPHPYDRKKRMVIPAALRTLRLRTGRKYTKVGDLMAKYGWNYQELVSTLEEKRKVASKAYYEKKQEELALKKQAKESANVPAEAAAILAEYGY